MVGSNLSTYSAGGWQGLPNQGLLVVDELIGRINGRKA